MTNTLPGLSMLCWLLVAVLSARVVDAQWVHKPSKELLDQTPGLIHETFESAAMKTTVGYAVVSVIQWFIGFTAVAATNVRACSPPRPGVTSTKQSKFER